MEALGFVLAGVAAIAVFVWTAAKGKAPKTWPCNDCGAPIPEGDQLCNSCFEQLIDEEEWEALHPELRCPPRE